MSDDFDIPDFLRVTKEDLPRRKAAWDKLPPPKPFVDPKYEAAKALQEVQKKLETTARIERMKKSLSKKPPKVDVTGKTWNINTSRWEDTEETKMQSERVGEYNRLAAILGKPTLNIKKFESKSIGEARIKKLQEEVDAREKPVQATESQQQEVPVAKKAAKKKSNGEAKGKNKVVLDLLMRKSGATVADAKKATGWEQVHFSSHAKKAGLKLRRERDKDGTNRYWAE